MNAFFQWIASWRGQVKETASADTHRIARAGVAVPEASLDRPAHRPGSPIVHFSVRRRQLLAWGISYNRGSR